MASPSPDDLAGTWQAFLAFIKQEEGGPLYAKLSRAHLTELSDHTLVISGDKTLNFHGSRQKTRVEELVVRFFGPQYRLHLDIQAAPAPKKAAPPEPKPLDLATLKQQALDVFGGRWLTPDSEEDSE